MITILMLHAFDVARSTLLRWASFPSLLLLAFYEAVQSIAKVIACYTKR